MLERIVFRLLNMPPLSVLSKIIRNVCLTDRGKSFISLCSVKVIRPLNSER
jgi:hypothetical protein